MRDPVTLQLSLRIALVALIACLAAASSIAATEATSPVSPGNLRALGTSFSRTIAKSLKQRNGDVVKAGISSYDDLARGGVIKSEGEYDESTPPINVYGTEGSGTKKTLGSWFEDLIDGMQKDLDEQDHHAGKGYQGKEGQQDEDEYYGDKDQHYHGSEQHTYDYKKEPKYEEYQHYEQVWVGPGVWGYEEVWGAGCAKHAYGVSLQQMGGGTQHHT